MNVGPTLHSRRQFGVSMHHRLLCASGSSDGRPTDQSATAAGTAVDGSSGSWCGQQQKNRTLGRAVRGENCAGRGHLAFYRGNCFDTRTDGDEPKELHYAVCIFYFLFKSSLLGRDDCEPSFMAFWSVFSPPPSPPPNQPVMSSCSSSKPKWSGSWSGHQLFFFLFFSGNPPERIRTRTHAGREFYRTKRQKTEKEGEIKADLISA